jgi:predicted DNA-binding transcriptional regulator YafY
MKVDTLIKMIKILPKSLEEAVRSTKIRDEYYLDPSNNASLDQASKNKHIRKQIEDLKDLGILGIVPYKKAKPVAGKDTSERTARYDKYYLLETELVKYFMDSKIALNLIWSKNIMQSLGQAYDAKNLEQTARHAPLNKGEQALKSLVRIVSDGIARNYATIEPKVLVTVLSAIEHGHRVALTYSTSQGKLVEDGPIGEGRAVLGLVAKDGTLYMINCKGFNDAPTHIPLHRVKSASEVGLRTFTRPDIELDTYLENQHQLAHVKRGETSPIQMVLKVSKEAMFHFIERPICGVDGSKQSISENPDGDGRHTLTVNVPYTVQLPPFLWSHAGWVEVISPPSLRKFVGSQLLAAAAHYQNDLPTIANVTT